ncbi:DUF4167 domain-containing protein [Humitalea rosea]|nr:DUF4167 domain-containing protein [Humitalea rosea]
MRAMRAGVAGHRAANQTTMNMKRMRGRGGNRHGGGGGGGSGGGAGGGAYRHAGQSGGGQQPLNRNHVFDSSGPDMRMRGTAQQLFEKYLQVGRDATGAGDRVMAESYFQHAEHYFRILNAMAQAATQHAPQQAAAQQQQGRWRNGPEQPGDQDGYQNDQPQNGQPQNGQPQNGQQNEGQRSHGQIEIQDLSGGNGDQDEQMEPHGQA